ncbi:MAG: DUF1295 domain-containing protein [Cyanobacteriota bacterium]
MESNKLKDYAFISSLFGSFILVLYAFLSSKYNIFQEGLFLFNNRITFSKNDAIIFILILSTSLMFIVEIIIEFILNKKKFIEISPDIKNKKYLNFFVECFLIYSSNLLLFYLIVLFYKYAPEYGNFSNNQYYKPWFFVLDNLFTIFSYFSIIYIPLTRAFKYNLDLEKKEYYHLFILPIKKISNLILKKDIFVDIEADYKNIILGLIVKMFFTPLMTIFFFDNFNNLVNNFNYLIGIYNAGLSFGYGIKTFSADIYNIGLSLIFSIDVLLAWGGYVISSRWISNNNISVEPTILGWFVALSCYPPFQIIPGVYFPIPSEKDIFNIPNDYLVLFFSILSIMSFFVYMSATMFFGLRFSNLTNRGIITVGLYKYIRHPAYASKNFSWWCIILPYVLYKIFFLKDFSAINQIIGLCSITYIYYLRALTEERHLSQDPDYLEYCKKVPYRFIPKVF